MSSLFWAYGLVYVELDCIMGFCWILDSWLMAWMENMECSPLASPTQAHRLVIAVPTDWRCSLGRYSLLDRLVNIVGCNRLHKDRIMFIFWVFPSKIKNLNLTLKSERNHWQGSHCSSSDIDVFRLHIGFFFLCKINKDLKISHRTLHSATNSKWNIWWKLDRSIFFMIGHLVHQSSLWASLHFKNIIRQEFCCKHVCYRSY